METCTFGELQIQNSPNVIHSLKKHDKNSCLTKLKYGLFGTRFEKQYTLNSTRTFCAARWFPKVISVRMVSLTLESTKMGCPVEISNSCCNLCHIIAIIILSLVRVSRAIRCKGPRTTLDQIATLPDVNKQMKLNLLHSTVQNKKVKLKARRTYFSSLACSSAALDSKPCSLVCAYISLACSIVFSRGPCNAEPERFPKL